MPINIGNMHWIAAAINFKHKRFEYFDSMGDYGSTMTSVFDVSDLVRLSYPLLPMTHKRIALGNVSGRRAPG